MGGAPHTLPDAGCPAESRGFGGKATLLPGCPKVGGVRWCPPAPGRATGPQIHPFVPTGGGTAASGDAGQDPSGHQLRLLSPQMVSKLPLMKTICNLHLDKLEFFRLLHPETAMNFPPLYKEVFNSELQYSDPRES